MFDLARATVDIAAMIDLRFSDFIKWYQEDRIRFWLGAVLIAITPYLGESLSGPYKEPLILDLFVMKFYYSGVVFAVVLSATAQVGSYSWTWYHHGFEFARATISKPAMEEWKAKMTAQISDKGDQ